MHVCMCILVFLVFFIGVGFGIPVGVRVSQRKNVDFLFDFIGLT